MPPPSPPTFFGRRQTIGFLMISGEWKSINSLNPLSASVTSFYMRATLGLNGLNSLNVRSEIWRRYLV